jgi:2-iminobutanoate/2-iminopropanoate deaminase
MNVRSHTLSIVGSMVFTSGICGANPDTDELPESVDEQVANCFKHLEMALIGAGGTMQDVGSVTLYVKASSLRPKISPLWLQHFPDEETRPTRYTIVRENLGYQVQLDAIAVLKS